MKRYLFVTFLLLINLLSLTGGSKAYAVDYISEIALASGSSSQVAIKQLEEENYTVIRRDLNENAGGDYIYLGYKTTTNYGDAITNLIVSIGKDEKNEVTINGQKYKMVTTLGSFNGDLNKDAGGKYIYLKYTKEGNKKGEPAITALSVIENEGSSLAYVAGYEGSTSKRNKIDFNLDAGGKYLYMTMTKANYSGDGELLCELFGVENLGSGYYKFVIPVIRKDKNQVINSLSGDLTVSIPDIKDPIFKLKCANFYEDEYFKSDDKEIKIEVPEGEKDEKGVVIDHWTFSEMDAGTAKCFIEDGDHQDCRMTTILWKAPKDFQNEESTFIFEGKTATPKNTNSGFKTTLVASTPKESKGMDTPMVIDPFLDMESGDPGWAKIMVVSTNDMLNLALLDTNTGKISTPNLSASTKNFEYDLEVFDETHYYVLLSVIKKTSFLNDGKQDYGYSLATTPFALKGLRRMQPDGDLSVDASYNYPSTYADPETAEGMLDGYRWVRFWKGGPRWLLLDDNYKKGKIGDTDPAKEAYSSHWRTPTKEEIEALCDHADKDYMKTYISLYGKGAYKLDPLHFSIFYSYPAAIPDKDPKDWEKFTFDNSPKFRYSSIGEDDELTLIAVVDEALPCDYLFTPTLKWKVKRPHTEDILEEDVFMVERAFEPMFLNPNVIDTKSLSDTLNTNDMEYAHFAFTDESEDRFNPKANSTVLNYFSTWENISDDAVKTLTDLKYEANYTYYRVSRSVIKTLWPKNNDYELKWRVLNPIVQPSITQIELEKSKSWDNDRAVKVTVKMDNPYIWEKVGSADTAAVHKEAIRQGFDHRMFQWNPKAKIRIVRYSPSSDHYNGKDEVEKTFFINGNNVKMDEKKGMYIVEIDDVLNAPHTDYYYKAIIDTTDVNWPVSGSIDYVSTSKQDWTRYDELTPVSHLEATRGTLQGRVSVSWEPVEDAYRTYRIERHVYGTEDEWMALDTVSTNFFNDTTAIAGQVYEYRVTAHSVFRGSTYGSTPVTAIGYNPYYGTIAGKIKLYNGYAMPGDSLTINIVSSDTILIKEVTDKNTGAVIMPGLQKMSFSKKVQAKSDGTYYCDSIPYLADKDITYTVSIEGPGGVNFTNAAGTNKPSITVNMTSDEYIHQDLDFTCNDVLKLSGDILYNGSTVPVANVRFTVNGVPMCDANGREITSDNEGHFSLLIPKKMPIKLRAEKKGHHFVNDGYLVGNAKEDKALSEGFAGKKLYDLTTVRLVGRVIGGDRQAEMPLGMAMSHNNLGDDICLELKLEGDDTSNIVFDLMNPEKTTRDTTFTQQVKFLSATVVDTLATRVSFQRKRIMLYADNGTGEFCVDLFPVKYKITSISAKGYSSLTNEGEGFEILDLSNCTDTLYVNNDDYLHKMEKQKIKGDQSARSTSYQATYQRVYHVPATVTLEQYGTNGATLSSLLGEKAIKIASLDGYPNEITTAYVENDTVRYAFDYPVFRDLKKYRFRATAHEDFYYNNERGQMLDKVLLNGGHLTVYNGLESAKTKIEAELDDNGQAEFVLNVDNPCFNLTDTAALRSVNAEVELHGYYYKASAIRGFVLGEEDAGTEIMTLDEEIEVMDVLRDPYGTNSYAWRDKGTEYHWDKDKKEVKTYSFNLSFNIGGGLTWYIGVGMAEKGSFALTGNFSLSNPITKNVEGEFGEYTMTLNERVETSSDPLMQGAMADVYIGRVDISHLRETNAFAVIDSASYSHLKNAVETGAVKMVKKGIDAQGKECYLVVGKKLIVATDSIASTFAYSQAHILGTIIPQLQKRYSELVMNCSKEEAEQLARATGIVRYYEDENGNPKMALPTKDYTGWNEAQKIKNTIIQWQSKIERNEEIKRSYVNTRESTLRTYSVSDQPVEFSENISAYYESFKYSTDGGPATISYGLSGNYKENSRQGIKERESQKSSGYDANSYNSVSPTRKEASMGGFIFSLNSLGGSTSGSSSSTNHAYVKNLRNTGFKLDLQDNGYMDLDVYKIKGGLLLKENGWDFVSSKTEKFSDFWNFDKTTVETGDYVFVYRGGSMRSPWFDADSTLFYKEGNVRVPLGERPKKIDNPKIYIANPVASNIRRDDKAIYSVRLTNETEYNGDPSMLKGIPLTLRLADNCNPHGAKITMDGAPISDGRQFQLKPGETITKTIEVARGDGYDFDDLGLVFHDQTLTLMDTAKFSMHFTPESTPVTLALPKNQWVMNTLSDRDKETDRFYLPVEITGFDTQYEEFDHIELQYKKQTEGESQWVNLCSFYAREDLYEKASGVKRMINSNTISDFAFYGEKDTIEMRYDLRAVSFCRLGTGFVTKSSNISSGIKDTRAPQVFGKTSPANDILTFGDVISVPFNEPIAYNYLDRTANFSVRGFTNNSDADHSARLRFDNNYAETKVKRSLKGTDFTLEMNVQLDKDSAGGMFFSMQEELSEGRDRLCFLYYNKGDQLIAFINDGVYVSEPLSSKYSINIHDVMTHVGLIYRAGENQKPSFIAGNTIIPANYFMQLDDNTAEKVGKITSQITLGGQRLHGYMSDVRLWKRQLNDYEVANLYQKKLNGSEGDLLCWWPMDEAMGNTVADHANGADLTLYGATWETPKGFSAKLDGKPLKIAKSTLFSTDPRQDFTLGFWFKADSLLRAADDHSIVNLFSAGSQNLKDKNQGKLRIGFLDEKLVLCAQGDTIDFGMNNNYVKNGQWHYLTLVSNNLHNLASLFIDGNMVAEVSADRVGHIAGSEVTFGSKGFSGYIDEVSMWHIALPQTYINDIKTTALTGREKELVAYMSFETDEQQSDNQMLTVFSPLNQKISESTGKIVGDRMFDPTTIGQESAIHAPMKKNVGITNIDFSWTCTNNDLQINLQCKDAEINNQRIDLVVRGVEDLQGNPMANPLMWSIYVNKNVLIWKEKTKQVDTHYGQGISVPLEWQNISGRTLNYTVETSASWLKLDRTMGTADPLDESSITVRVSDGLAPGEYTAIVNLTDVDGLVSKLFLEVNVEAADPNWEVTTGQDYAESMFITAKVRTEDNAIDTDERDIVAAFYNGICLGKANIQRNEDNSAFVYLTVHGNKKTHNQKLLFYLWNKSKGEIKRLKPVLAGNKNDIRFTPDSIMGSHSNPVVMVCDSISIQSIDLKRGWNWVSFNVKPFVTSDVNSLFLDNSIFSTGDLFKGSLENSNFTEFYGEDVNLWGKGAESMPFNISYVYQMYINNPCTVQVEGYEIEDKDRVLKFKQGGWTQLPYLLKKPQLVSHAMSDYSIDKAQPGSVIKSYKAFAVIDTDGKWYGSLDYLRPGEGYFVNNLGAACTISFDNSEKTESDDSQASAATRATASDQSVSAVYDGAMPVIATFADDDVLPEDILVAYCDDKEVGRASASVLTRSAGTASHSVYFLMVNATDNAAIRFAKERDGETLEVTTRAIKFNSDAIIGTLDHPFVIDFSPISDRDVYDISGRRHDNSEQLQRERVYIINGKKNIEK